jgi:Mg-chelatase subunit ChlD
MKKPAKKATPVKTPEAPAAAQEVTEIVCVIDRSGSMQSIKTDAIGGFNNFLADQQKLPDPATMTLILFDTEYLILNSGTPIKEVQPLNDTTFVPRGSTALLDATGRAINEVNQRNPKKALIMILTDGHENASREFQKQQIKQMIADCEKKGWAVIYLSADANAFDDGASIGIGANNIASFQQTARGANVSSMAASYATVSYRTTGAMGQSMRAYSMSAGKDYDAQHPHPRPKIL